MKKNHRNKKMHFTKNQSNFTNSTFFKKNSHSFDLNTYVG